jgi:hypothetical protein
MGEGDGVILLPLSQFTPHQYTLTAVATLVASTVGRVAVRVFMSGKTNNKNVKAYIAHDAAHCTATAGYEIDAGDHVDLELPAGASIYAVQPQGSPGTLSFADFNP